MIRLLIAVFLIALGATVAIWFSIDPGEAEFTFRGWVVETTFARAAVGILLVAFLLALIWRFIGWLIGLPGKARQAARRARARRGYDALEQALIASAAGDGGTARRQATRAGELLDRPLLTRVISARAAEAAGEFEAAEADYRLLLEEPKAEIVGLRGLAQAAHARGDHAEAQRQAALAFTRNPRARWAFDTLFEAQARKAEWAEALQTLAAGERQAHVTTEVARRRRAVLLAAEAAGAEAAGEYERALPRAMTATQICPGFPPAATLAARMLKRAGNEKKAAKVLEEAWKAAPHPALALIWRDLEPPAAAAPERAARLDRLAALAPDHRESRILAAEAALLRGDAAAADAAIAPVPGPLTARMCVLAARIAEARKDEAAARILILQAAGAPGEPDWSDVDPEGPAFAFAEEDWARLVFAFGDDGVLIHPRHEQFQPELVADAPSLKLLAPPPAPVAAPAEPQPEPAPEPAPAPAPPAPAAEPGPPSPDDPGPAEAGPDDDEDDQSPRPGP